MLEKIDYLNKVCFELNYWRTSFANNLLEYKKKIKNSKEHTVSLSTNKKVG